MKTYDEILQDTGLEFPVRPVMITNGGSDDVDMDQVGTNIVTMMFEFPNHWGVWLDITYYASWALADTKVSGVAAMVIKYTEKDLVEGQYSTASERELKGGQMYWFDLYGHQPRVNDLFAFAMSRPDFWT